MKISSRKQLSFVLKADYMMNRGKFSPSFTDRLKNLLLPDYIMAYLAVMRKASFYKGWGGIIGRILFLYYSRKFRALGIKLGFSIDKDSLGYGVVIPHHGTIVIGGSNSIGNYAVLHTSICISANGKNIGNGLYCATGVKMTSRLTLGNNVSVGANSVVNKSFESDDIMIAGMPANYIKEKKAWYLGSSYEQKVQRVEELRKILNVEL